MELICVYCHRAGQDSFTVKTRLKLEQFGLRAPICVPCLNDKTDAVHQHESPVKLLLDETQHLLESSRKRFKNEGIVGGKRMMREVDNLYAQLPWVELWLQHLMDRLSFRDKQYRHIGRDRICKTVRQWNALRSNLSSLVSFLSKHVSVAYKTARHEANLIIRRSWVRDRVFRAAGFRCVICQSAERLCVDHIIPVSLGGTNEFTNFQALCLSCNSRKGERSETQNCHYR